jgi:DNA end-binding protein Ku
MAARAIWKGELKLGTLTMPVKLYSAVQDQRVRFHMIRSKTKSRVKQRMLTESHQHIESENIRKAYETEPGTFVVLEPAELTSLKPKESRTITFARFVPTSAIGHEWFERPYYLAPDGAAETYFALAKALEEKNAAGIAQWTMRGRAYVGALRSEAGCLALIKLRYSDEIFSARELPVPAGRQFDEKELRMADELMAALEGKFDPGAFRDEYQGRLRKFIDAKAHGKRPRLAVIKDRRPAGSLDEQLARSLAAVKRGKEKIA